jgi:anti-sigma factor RsiW
VSSERTITCQELTEVLTDYLEGVMPVEDRERFEAHLAICDGCQWYLDQMRITIAAVGRIEDDEVPAELRDTVLAAFRSRRV